MNSQRDSKDQPYDAIIVGGGPAGLTAALFLGRACRRVIVVDAGQPRNAAAAHLHGFLGRDGICPNELLSNGRRDLSKYDVEVLNDQVIHVQRLPEAPEYRRSGFQIETRDGRHLTSRKIVFCTGLHDDLPRFAGVRECYGHSVHHCPYCDGWEYRDRHLLACGDSGRSAIGLGLLLRNWSDQVTVLTDGQPITASERQAAEVNRIAILEEHVVQIIHEGHQLIGIDLGSRGVLPAAALFFNSSYHRNCDLPQLLGCEDDSDETTPTSKTQSTKAPGVFVAGDADGDVQFAVIAAGEGATAAVAIVKELQLEEQLERERCLQPV